MSFMWEDNSKGLFGILCGVHANVANQVRRLVDRLQTLESNILRGRVRLRRQQKDAYTNLSTCQFDQVLDSASQLSKHHPRWTSLLPIDNGQGTICVPLSDIASAEEAIV